MILITGGLGYIGSHIAIQLINNNNNIVIIDNLSNSSIDKLDKIKQLVNNKNELYYYNVDLKNEVLVDNIFKTHKIKSVIHCAGLKSVSESIELPVDYYYENINNSLSLFKSMKKAKCFSIVFSSSATVYGNSSPPFTEESNIGYGISNPYGKTKFMIEHILKDISDTDDPWKITILRYFNPIGNHPSGLIGDDPNGKPNNLMPYLLRVARYNHFKDISFKDYEQLTVFGNDYSTKDGTGERDYIHVMDLSNAHINAIKYQKKGYNVYNIGNGNPISVLELINAFEKHNNILVPYKINKRREGDSAISYCDNKKALKELKFKCDYNIENMVKDSWKFILKFYE